MTIIFQKTEINWQKNKFYNYWKLKRLFDIIYSNIDKRTFNHTCFGRQD